MIFRRSESGATITCRYCGTTYDNHGVDIMETVPPVGDGCDKCDPPDEDENGERSCGCPLDYHTADCPHLTGSHGPATKQDWLEMYGDMHPDDWPDSEE